MVFNKDILFIHIGKTGGTSAADYLCKTLLEPVYNVIPERAHGKQIGHEVTLDGQRHATLEEAKVFLKKRNIKLNSFKEIIAVIRHPYNLEISLFNYYKRLLANQPQILDNAPKRKAIILKDSFEEFVRGRFFHRHNTHIKKYLAIEGKLHPKVRIIKFENLETEFLKIGEKYGNGNEDFPHLNKTKSTKIEEWITPEIELRLYRKYKWVFLKGKYKRLNFNA